MQVYDYKDGIDFRIKLGTVVSFKLCEIIVANRYLNTMKDAAIMCIQELNRRRSLGDDFEFEKIVEELQEKLPKIKRDMKDVMKNPFTGLKKLPGIFRGMR